MRSTLTRNKPQVSAQARISQLVGLGLVAYLAIAYSGLVGGYIPGIKFDLSPLDGLAACCCLILLFHERDGIDRVSYVLPFVVWVLIYYAWGLVVHPDPGPVMHRVINRLIMIPLIVASVATALSSRRRVTLLCDFIQVVAVVNCVVCVLQALDIQYVVQTIRPGLHLNENELLFINFRPVGLWANQNQAARLFVFALLLSFWARPSIAWVSRGACAVGIYLTASRFGAFMLIANVFAMAMFIVFTGRFRAAAKGMAVTGCGLLAAAATWFLVVSPGTRDALVGSSALAGQNVTRLARLGDIADDFSNPTASHQTLTLQALERASNGTWYGSGIYTFQEAEEGMLSGAHNLYIAVWGETGVWGLLGYPVLLLLGASRIFRLKLRSEERFILLLFWGTWLLAGFASHVDLESPMAYVAWGLLFALPAALRTPRTATHAAPASPVKKTWTPSRKTAPLRPVVGASR